MEPKVLVKLIFQKFLKKKIGKILIINENQITNKTLETINELECLIIDNFQNNINQNLLYSIFNQSKQLENYIVINSTIPINRIGISLKDLKSRINSFVYVGIELPTDELLMVIISKYFSDKQIAPNPK